MNANFQERSGQKEFLEIKTHKSEVIEYLLGCVVWCWDKWRLVWLHPEYDQIKEKLKKC